MIPEKIRFGDLHRILQIAFGWEDQRTHAFTFSQDTVRVTDERVLERDDLPEDEFEVDDFIYINKWIRYTYDLGEDRKHKIILEKVQEDYDLRYATIVRAKGGDLGGGDPCGEFSLEEANRLLAKLEFMLPAEKLEPVLVKNKPSRPSKMAGRIREWGYFSYGENRHEEKTAAGRSCVEVLQDLSLREIRDYCRYLQIPTKVSWNKKRSAETVYNAFVLHPEYLLYVLDAEEFQGLLRFCERPEGSLAWSTEEFAVDKYMALGLMEVHIEEDPKGKTASYALAQGAGTVIDLLRGRDWGRISQEIRQDGGKILDCLQVYGIMEVDACYGMCRDIWDLDLERDDFLRLLYWYGRFNGYIRTLEREDGLRYAMLSEMSVERTMAYFFQADGAVGYRKIAGKELERRRKGMIWAEECWALYIEYMKNVVGLEAEELGLWMEEERLDALCGATATDLMENVCGTFPPEVSASWVELWLAVMDVCMDAGLFVLKGYSRNGYKELTGEAPAFLPVFHRGLLEERISWDTHIYQMPEEIQYRLYEAYRISFIQRAQVQMEDILNDLPEGNLEISYMLALCQMAGGSYTQAQDTVRKVQEAYAAAAKDPSLAALSEMIKEQEQKSLGATYRRGIPKIGRNDPCPCGSGKKYKKCCGRGE